MSDRKIIRIKEDFDIKGNNGLWLKSWSTPSGIRNEFHCHISLSCERWHSILRRVKNTRNSPTYRGIINNFESYQQFVEWSVEQPGYDMKEPDGRVWAIDKDILGDGRTYSPEFCIFVPQKVNNFLTLRTNHRGIYPIGVSCSERGDRIYYFAGVNMGGGTKLRKTGTFYDPMSAHRFWQENKIIRARNLASEFKGWHNNLYIGLNSWADKIQDDYENHRETVIEGD